VKVKKPLRRRAGFIFLFGSRTLVSAGGEPPVHTHCPRCGHEADLVSKRYRHWFTFFFLPVFPISAGKSFCQCSRCGAQFQIPAEELRSRVADADQHQAQQAIVLYNSLRASPANSVTLNQLMAMYASMKEYDQAISAANDFPQALQASEQCMATLGRVYLAQSRHTEALNWLDQAITRNPQFGEAQYYKGLTHLLMIPSDLPRAISAARAARNAAYPNADALLRDAEAKARESA